MCANGAPARPDLSHHAAAEQQHAGDENRTGGHADRFAQLLT
jgi:predicted alpha/beta superfamily hydrolase